MLLSPPLQKKREREGGREGQKERGRIAGLFRSTLRVRIVHSYPSQQANKPISLSAARLGDSLRGRDVIDISIFRISKANSHISVVRTIISCATMIMGNPSLLFLCDEDFETRHSHRAKMVENGKHLHYSTRTEKQKTQTGNAQRKHTEGTRGEEETHRNTIRFITSSLFSFPSLLVENICTFIGLCFSSLLFML